MEEKDFIRKSARETEDLAERFAHNFKPGDIILLTGAFGAGKTTFVQGVARKFNVKSRVISPTFVLVRTHKGQIKGEDINFYHIDLYRIEGRDEIKELGLEEFFEDKDGISFVEWGGKFDIIKPSWEVIFHVIERNTRKITLRNCNHTPGV